MFARGKQWLLVLPALALLSCGSGPSARQVLAELEAITESMCACRDERCIDEVNDRFGGWSSRNRNHRSSSAEEAKLDELLERYAQCMLAPGDG